MISLIIHISLLSLMVILEIVAVIVAIRKKKNWFFYHKVLAGVGVFSGVAGVLTLVIAKIITEEGHFYTLHSKIGIAVTVALILNLLSGFFMRKLPKKVKKWHKYLGFITLTAVLVSAISGIILILP